MVSNDIVGQCVDSAVGHAPTLFENQELTRDATRKRKLLLDQEHGDAGLLVQPQDDVADLVHDVRLNSLSRLVED